MEKAYFFIDKWAKKVYIVFVKYESKEIRGVSGAERFCIRKSLVAKIVGLLLHKVCGMILNGIAYGEPIVPRDLKV
jgi:hypothetical protein